LEDSAVSFLLLVLVVSAIGAAVVMLRHRQPTGMQSSIAEFEKGLAAIAPEPQSTSGPSRQSGS